MQANDDRPVDALLVDGRNAVPTHGRVATSGNVIAKRLTLALSGISGPANADQAKLERVVPEKSAAVAANALGLVDRSGQLVERMARFTTDEILLASRACVTLAACRTPTAFITAQQGLAFAWMVRCISQTTKIGALAMQWPGDATRQPGER